MKPIKFKESNIVFAKDQPEYLPLPAYRNEKGDVISLWQFNFFERIKVLLTGKMWFHVLTFNNPLQPQRPTLQYPFERKKLKLCDKQGWPLELFMNRPFKSAFRIFCQLIRGNLRIRRK